MERGSSTSRSRLARYFLLLVVAAGFAAVVAPAIPRATFQPDDYRYLRQVREANHEGLSALLDGMVVENRWDDNWWVADGSFVRFYRPFVILSYVLDRILWGEDPRGYVVSNIVWHVLASWLAWLVLRRLLRNPAAAAAGGVLFLFQSCHFGHVSYVAGRTDTFAGVFVFAMLAWFLRGREQGGSKWAVGVALLYLGALFAKEYSVVVPLFCYLIDRWMPVERRPGSPDRSRLWLYASLGVALVVYLAIRTAALGEGGSGARIAPYVFVPGHQHFAEHVATTGLLYAVMLVTGDAGATFLTGWEELRTLTHDVWIWVSAAVVLGLVGWGWRTRAGRVCAVVFVTMLVPMLMLYSTGRYLYLPSLGWCGLVGLAFTSLRAPARVPAVLGFLAVVGLQAVQHRAVLSGTPRWEPGRGIADVIVDVFRSTDLDLESERSVYLLDAPLTWLEIQFLEDMLFVKLSEQAPPIRVLCKAPIPPGSGQVVVRRRGEQAVDLRRPRGVLNAPHPHGDFAAAGLQPGQEIVEDGHRVTVMEVEEGRATRVRVRFDAALDGVQLGRFEPTPTGFRLRREGTEPPGD